MIQNLTVWSKHINKPKIWRLAEYLLVVIFCSIFWDRMFHYRDGDVVAQIVPIWGDWALHANIVSGFAYRPVSEWFIDHPVYYGMPFSYPFAADLISSFLVIIGVNLVWSLVFPSIVTSFCLYLVLKRLYIQILNKRSAGYGFIIFLVLFLFSVGNLTNKVLVPQRPILLGLTWSLFMLSLLIGEIMRGRQRVGRLLSYGMGAGLLFIVHPHSVLIMLLSSACYGITKKRIKSTIVFITGLGMVGVPLYFCFYAGNLSSNFFTFFPKPFPSTLFTDGPWLFFIILSVLATYVTGTFRQPLVLCGWLIILLCGVISFQPWDWDNTKLLTYAVTFLNFYISIFLADLMKKNVTSIAVSIALIIFIIHPSLRQWNLDLLPTSTGYVLWNADDIKLARDLRMVSSQDSLILVQGDHNNSIANLSGRQILMGYDGWLWSYGINYFGRKDLVEAYYRCNNKFGILDKWGIDYVVFSADSSCSLNGLLPIMENDHYRVYQVLR